MSSPIRLRVNHRAEALQQRIRPATEPAKPKRTATNKPKPNAPRNSRANRANPRGTR